MVEPFCVYESPVDIAASGSWISTISCSFPCGGSSQSCKVIWDDESCSNLAGDCDDLVTELPEELEGACEEAGLRLYESMNDYIVGENQPRAVWDMTLPFCKPAR